MTKHRLQRCLVHEYANINQSHSYPVDVQQPLVRGRAVNNLVYWLSQIAGSIVIGLLLDSPKVKRRTRAFLGWGILFAMVFIVHIWAYFYQM